MILKQPDDKTQDIKALKKLLTYNLNKATKDKILFTIQIIEKGINGETNSKKEIDRLFASSKDWFIIHDLALSMDDMHIQIDHLLINRIFEIYVIESKDYSNNVKILENGEFEVKANKGWTGIPSPIQQNKRHIDFLKKFINKNELLPKRVSLLEPNFLNYVLFSPQATIQRPEKRLFDSSNVVKVEFLENLIKKNFDNRSILNTFSSLLKISSTDTVREFAENLIKYHSPIKTNWYNKFVRKSHTNGYFCAKCKQSITKKVADFCFSNKNIFKNKAYCYTCQKVFKKEKELA